MSCWPADAIPRSCASPAPDDVVPVELDDPLPLEPEPETPALLEVPPLGEVLAPELIVPEVLDDVPAVLPVPLVPPDVRSLDIEPLVDVPLPLDTDPLPEPEGLVLPVEERPPGAALGLDAACASLLH